MKDAGDVFDEDIAQDTHNAEDSAYFEREYAKAKPKRLRCWLCGLRVEKHAGGWGHLPTVAGLEAERDHRGRPPYNPLADGSG